MILLILIFIMNFGLCSPLWHLKKISYFKNKYIISKLLYYLGNGYPDGGVNPKNIIFNSKSLTETILQYRSSVEGIRVI